MPTFSTLPPEMHWQIFDTLIQDHRKVRITCRRSSSNIFLPLLQSCILVRDSIIVWLASRPRLIWSEIHSIGIYDPANTTFVLDFSKKGGLVGKPIATDGPRSCYETILNSKSVFKWIQYIKIDATWGCLDENIGENERVLLLYPFLHLYKLQNLKRLDISIGKKNWDRLIGHDFCEGCDEWMHIWSHVFMWFQYCTPDEHCTCGRPLPIVFVGDEHGSWVGLRWSPIGLRNRSRIDHTFQAELKYRVGIRRMEQLYDIVSQRLLVANGRLKILKKAYLCGTVDREWGVRFADLIMTKRNIEQELTRLDTIGTYTEEGGWMEERIAQERLWLASTREAFDRERAGMPSESARVVKEGVNMSDIPTLQKCLVSFR